MGAYVYAGQRVTAALLNTSYALSDATAFPVTATSLAQISNNYTIAAGEPAAGSVYRLRAYGSGTQGSTAQSLEFAASFGGVTTGTPLTFGPAFCSAGTAFRWWAEAEAMCLSTGSGATWQLSLITAAGPGTSISNGIGQNATPVTVSTEAAIAFEITAAWGSATGSPTVTGLRSVLQRIL